VTDPALVPLLTVTGAGGRPEGFAPTGQPAAQHRRRRERGGGEAVIFADRAGQVHARRWTNRQSGLSAVQTSTTALLL